MSVPLSIWPVRKQAIFGSVALAVAYYAAMRVGYLFIVPPMDSAAIWPAAGVGVAALLLWGPGLWPGLWLAAFLAPVLRGGPILAALITATAKVGLTVWAASILGRHFAPTFAFTHSRHLMTLVGIAVGVSGIGATVGTAVSLAYGRIAWTAAGANWLAWMVGDCAGILLVTPLALAWVRHPRPTWSRNLWLELSGGCLVIGGVGAGAFGPWLPGWPAEHCALALVFGLAWAAARFDQRTMSTLTALIAMAAVWGARAGHGAFAAGGQGASLVMLEVYIILLAATGLLLAAISARRRVAEAALLQAYDQMEAKVRERTAALASRTQQLDAVGAVAAELTQELDLMRLLRLIHERVTALLGGTTGTLHIWDEENQTLVPHTWQDPGGWRQRLHLRLGEDVAGTVAARREGLLVNDFRTSTYAMPFHLEHTRHTAVLAEPLLYHDRLLGVIAIENGLIQRPFTEEDQQILRLFAAHAAIAIENARLFAELNRSFARLQDSQAEMVRTEKLRALGQLGAGIAHDLNNSLAVVLGQAELLRCRTENPEMLENIRTLETAATDGAQIVRRLQDFGRQRTSQQLSPVNLAAVVREALEMTRPRWRDEMQRHGRQIAVEVALGSLPPVLGHAPELREALMNLILNAVDAMPDGGALRFTGRVVDSSTGQFGEKTALSSQSTNRPINQSTSKIELQSQIANQKSQMIELTVTDTGAGMPEAVRQKVFDPFFTTKGVRGTGLGLSVVCGIVERHGGRIDVASALGHGTTFTLRLQAAVGAPAAEPALRVRSVSPRRLLLIDDEAAVRRTLRDLLQAIGHTVFEAAGGAEGLQVLQGQCVDAVLTDLGMPEMTGWEVARAVKTASPGLPVILLTGWGDSAAAQAAEVGLVDRVLGKPVRLDELLKTVAELTPERPDRRSVVEARPAEPALGETAVAERQESGA